MVKKVFRNYLYEKKVKRIKYDYKNIICFHVLNYIKFIRRKRKNKFEKDKVY